MTSMHDTKTEQWLERETRKLPMPDGSARLFTDFRMVWAAFDHLVDACGFTPNEIVEVAVDEAAAQQREDLDFVFSNVVAFLDQEMGRIRGTT